MSLDAANDSSATEEVFTDHCYDGILEYDNPLPGWWLFLFWLFIIFAPIYYLYFQMGPPGRTVHDQYEREMASVFELKFNEIGELKPDRETILKYMDQPKWVNFGKVVYQINCVSCHRADGGGLVGPNLTDQHWKNVRNVEGIAAVIADGAANGAMPSWKNRLSHPNQIVLAAVYVASLQQSPAANGKAPEGNLVAPWKE